jgi:cobalamin synthase
MNGVKQQAVQVMQDDRTGAAAAAGTVATSLATVFDWIPQNVGNAGIAVGIVLSVTLIVINIRSEMRKTKMDNLIIKLREKELKDERGL